MVLTISSLILICILGYLSQSIGLCLVRGVNAAKDGKPLFLIAILLSGCTAWVAGVFAYIFNIQISLVNYQVTLLSMIGGFLFGLGAAFNNGCGVSTISKLSRGHLTMLITVLGWFIGWLLLTKFRAETPLIGFIIKPIYHFTGLFILSLIVVGFTLRISSENKKILFTMLGIGLLGSLVFLIEPKWTPSALLKDMSYSYWLNDYSLWPDMSRYILISFLILGMLIAALRAKTFKLIIDKWQVCVKHLLAGICMGIGAALASGGNDSQLLLALPGLSLAGFVSVLFMLVGIFVGSKCIK